MEECVNLRFLDLSCNWIGEIEGIETLTNLKELNLAENCIKVIQGLRTLRTLETLNLSGNQLRLLPKAELSPLLCLKVLKLSRNRIQAVTEIHNLAVLPVLLSLYIGGNSVCLAPNFDQVVVSSLSGLEMLEGVAVKSVGRLKRWESEGGEGDIEKLERKKTDLSSELQSIEIEIRDAKSEAKRSESDLSTIEKSLSSLHEFHCKKSQMRDFLTKAEEMRITSQDLQRCIKQCREEISSKETSLELLRKRSRTNSLLDPDSVLDAKETAMLRDLKGLRTDLQSAEQAYDEVLVELQIKMEKIEDLEREISGNDHFSEQTLQLSEERETMLNLPKKKEEILAKIPATRKRIEELEAKKQRLLSEESSIDLSLSRIEEIKPQNRHKKSSSALTFQLKSRSQQAFEALKDLYQTVSGSELEIESDEIDIAVLTTAKRIQKELFKREQNYLQEVENRSKAQEKVADLTREIEELRETRSEKYRNSALQEAQNRIDELEKQKLKLEILCENFELQVKKLTDEHRVCKEALAAKTALQSQFESLLQENDRLKSENVGVLDLQVRSLRKQREAAEVDYREVKEEVDLLNGEAEEARRDVTALKREVMELREELEGLLPAQKLKEEKENAMGAVRKIAGMLGVPSRSDLPQLIEEIDEKLVDLQEDLSRADRFHISKTKFLNLFESNTAQLNEEWQRIAEAKRDLESALESEAERARRMAEEEEVSEERVKELQAEAKDVKKRCEEKKAEIDKITEEIAGAKEKITYLKSEGKSLTENIEKLRKIHSESEDDLASLQNQLESQASQYQESADALRSLKKELIEQSKQRMENDTWLQMTRGQLEKLEGRRKELEEEVQKYEEKCRAASERLTREERTTREDLESRVRLLDEKKSLILQSEQEISSLQSELSEIRHQRLMLSREHETETREIIELKANRQQLRAEIRELEDIVENTRKKERAVSSDVESLIAKRKDTEDSMNKLKIDIEFAVKTLDSNQRESDTAKKDAENQQSRLVVIREDTRKAELTLSDLTTRVADIQKNIDLKAGELAEMSRAISLKESLISDLKLEQHRFASEIESQKSYFSHFSKEKEQIQTEFDRTRSTLLSIQQQKKTILNDIQRLCSEFEAVENKHKSDVDNLSAAIAHNEKTLQQLTEAVNKEKATLEEMLSASERSKETMEIAERRARDADERVKKLKTEEETAMILLAASGHRVDQQVVSRIQQLCKAEEELSVLKSRAMSREDSLRSFPVRSSPLLSMDESSTFQPNISSQSQRTAPPLPGQVSEMQRLLEHVERERRRITAMMGSDMFAVTESRPCSGSKK